MQNYDVKVSVVIPIYNVEEYLAECVDSVIHQTLREIEVICVNDASTDNSMKILEPYRKMDNRIHIYTNEANCGLAYTRNVGIQKAKGKYIYALDSDDKIKLDALQKLYEIAEETGSDVITFEGELLFQNGEIEKKFNDYTICRHCNYPKTATGKEFFCLFMENHEWVASIPRHFYRREFIISNELQFIRGIVEEDEFFSFQAYKCASQVVHIKEKLFVRRFRENSITTEMNIEKTFIGKLVTFVHILKCSVSVSSEDEYEKAVEKYMNALSGSLLRLYDRLDNDTKDKLKWDNDELNISYQIFRRIVDAKRLMIKYEYDMNKIMELENVRVNIFGAGIKAKQAIPILLENNVKIKNIVVSSSKNNVPSLYGIEVKEMELLEAEASTPIIICVAGRDEIKQTLIKKGFKNIVDIYK